MLSDGGSPHPRCRGTPRVGGLPSFAHTFRFPRLDASSPSRPVPRVSLVPRVRAVGVVMLSFDVGGFSLSRKQTLTSRSAHRNQCFRGAAVRETNACLREGAVILLDQATPGPARKAGVPPPLDFFFSLPYAPNNSLEPNWGISHAASSRQQLPLLAAQSRSDHGGASWS